MTVGVLCAVAALVGFWVVIAFWPLGTRCNGGRFRNGIDGKRSRCRLEAGHLGPCR